MATDPRTQKRRPVNRAAPHCRCSHAGPVYVYAVNSAVHWGGWVGTDSCIKVDYNDRYNDRCG